MRPLAIAIIAILMAASGFSQWIQLGSDIDGEAGGDRSGEAVSLSADGSIAAIGAKWNHGTGDLSGHVRIFQWDGTGWIQRGNDIDGEVAWDRSGEELSLSADGNIVAIGAREHGDSGHVRIYQWNGTEWIQRGSDIDGETAGDDSGYSVSLSDDGGIVAIGAVENDDNGNKSGHVRIYQWNTTEWVQLGNDINGEAAEDSSGWSVSLSFDGNIAAIGATGNDDNGTTSGHVRIYQWNGTEWIQRGSDIDGEAAADNSGYSVSLSDDGNIVAIGAPGNSENGQVSGHVRIYQWAGSADGSDGVPASPLPGYEIVHEPVAVEIAENTGLLSAFLEGFEAEVVKVTPLCSGGQWRFNRPGNGVAVRHYVVEDMDLAASGLGIGAYIKANFTSGDSTLPHHNLLWVGSQIDHDGNSSSRSKAFKIRGWTTGGGSGSPFNFDVSNSTNPITFRLDTDGTFKWIKSGQTNWATSTVDYDGPNGSAATGVVPDGWSVYMAYAAKNSSTKTIYSSPLNVIHENCNTSSGAIENEIGDGTEWIQRGSDIDGEAQGDFSGKSVSLSADGNIVAISATGHDDSGHVRIFHWNETEWIQRGSDIDGETAEDSSGWSASLSADGNIVAIGAPGNGGNGHLSGHVRIYEYSSSSGPCESCDDLGSQIINDICDGEFAAWPSSLQELQKVIQDAVEAALDGKALCDGDAAGCSQQIYNLITGSVVP